jgi:hypothetical protein
MIRLKPIAEQLLMEDTQPTWGEVKQAFEAIANQFLEDVAGRLGECEVKVSRLARHMAFAHMAVIDAAALVSGRYIGVTSNNFFAWT